MNYEQLVAEMRNEEDALELQKLVKEFFENYLHRVEETDSGKEFSPVMIRCCRVFLLEPLNNLLDRMAKLSGATRKEKNT